MDRLIISGPGYPGTTELLEFLDSAHAAPVAAIGRNFGANVILSGVGNFGSTDISSGWVCIGGEILPFVGGPLQSEVVVIEQVVEMGYDSAGDGNFTNQQPVWKCRHAQFGTMAETGAVMTIPFSSLKRISSLEDIEATRLRLLRKGVLNYFQQQNAQSSSLNVTGNFTGVTEIPTGDTWTRKFKIDFPAVAGEYVPVITRTGSDTYLTQSTLVNHDNSSLTILVRFDKYTNPNGSVTIGWFEQHLNIYLLGIK